MIITSSATDIARILKQGGVIAYPTEAVWGLGCDPYNEAAVKRILALKQRPMEKGLILVAGHQQELAPWQKPLSQTQFTTLTSVTDKPTSWVVPDQTIAPTWVRGQHASVAIRLSQHLPVCQLCQAFGGVVVSTSANPSGLSPALSIEQVQHYFKDQIEAIFDAPLGNAQEPSQVKDLLTNNLYRS